MSNIATISELLTLSQCQYELYDVGRKIDKLSHEQFLQIENNMLPYPFPNQGHACLAIAFWQEKSPQPYLWFVKLPLDERGLLNQGARNHFIAIIIEALGADLSVDPTAQQEELLKSNPYHFTPAQYKLATLNSLLKLSLKQAPSSYYPACQAYFHGLTPIAQWQEVGVQGICDYAARLNESFNGITNEAALISILEKLPEPVLNALCSALEHQKINAKLTEKLISLFWWHFNAKAHHLALLLLRALASNSETTEVQNLITKLLKQEVINEEYLITLAGRHWQGLANIPVMMEYLEALVNGQANDLFPAIFKDLVAIPLLRPILLLSIREPKRSEALAKAIGLLFVQNTVH